MTAGGPARSRPSGFTPYQPGPWALRGDRFLAHALSESLSGRDPLPAISAAETAFLIDCGELPPDERLADWADELPEFHERTCNYWYTVTCGAMSHTAFTTKRGLMRWLDERGLTLGGELPAARGESASVRVIGEYREATHGEFSPTEEDPYRMVAGDDFYAIRPAVITAEMSNGRYTLALITADSDGVRTVHTLNPNVKTRFEPAGGTVAGTIAMRNEMDRETANADL